MSEPITVSVTAADIEAGQRGSCAGCPVALALQRATGDAEASVDWAIKCDHRVVLTVYGRGAYPPTEVEDFVEAFDRGGASDPACKPFTFTIQEWFDFCEECERLMYSGSCEECGT